MLADILRRARVDVVVVSVEKRRQIVGSKKIKIIADKCISDASKSTYDLIILPVSLLVFFFIIFVLLDFRILVPLKRRRRRDGWVD